MIQTIGKIFALVSVAFPLLVSTASANGVLQVRGKIVSFSAKEVVVQVGTSQLYTLDRAMLLKADSQRITRTEVPVNFSVPMDGVKSVRDIEPPAVGSNASTGSSLRPSRATNVAPVKK